LKIYINLFLTGLALGWGPCLSFCAPILAPYIAGSQNNWLGGLKLSLAFSVARIAPYVILSLVSASVGQYLVSRFYQTQAATAINGVAGLFICLLGVIVLLGRAGHFSFCKAGKKIGGQGLKEMILLGTLVGFAPCAPLLGVLTYIAFNAGNLLQAATFGLVFGLGTIISPVILLGLAAGAIPQFLIRRPNLYKIFTWACGIILIYLGVTMISENVQKIQQQLPAHVQLVAAAKTRTAEEIQQAIDAGVGIIGANYVQEAERVQVEIGKRVNWHFIGHLQKNKAKKAVKLFDMIETVDSLDLAEELSRICAGENKVMPVLVEINSGEEKQKFGVSPQAAEELVQQLSGLNNIKVMGLMTMAPYFENPTDARPYFTRTKKIFDAITALDLESVRMQYLSMGMSDTYQIAIEEGANLVRVGSKIFGEREA